MLQRRRIGGWGALCAGSIMRYASCLCASTWSLSRCIYPGMCWTAFDLRCPVDPRLNRMIFSLRVSFHVKSVPQLTRVAPHCAGMRRRCTST